MVCTYLRYVNYVHNIVMHIMVLLVIYISRCGYTGEYYGKCKTYK